MIVLITGGSGSGKSAYAEQRALQAERNLQERNSSKVEVPKFYLATMRVMDAESEARVQRHRRMRSRGKWVTIEQPVDIEQAAARIACRNSVVLLECLSNLAANEMFREYTDPMEAELGTILGFEEIKSPEGLHSNPDDACFFSQTESLSPALGNRGIPEEIALPDSVPGNAYYAESAEPDHVRSDLLAQITSRPAAAGNPLERGTIPESVQKVRFCADKILYGIRRLSESTDCFLIVTNNVFEDGIRYDAETTAYLRLLATLNTRLAEMADEVTEVVAGIPVRMK